MRFFSLSTAPAGLFQRLYWASGRGGGGVGGEGDKGKLPPAWAPLRRPPLGDCLTTTPRLHTRKLGTEDHMGINILSSKYDYHSYPVAVWATCLAQRVFSELGCSAPAGGDSDTSGVLAGAHSDYDGHGETQLSTEKRDSRRTPPKSEKGMARIRRHHRSGVTITKGTTLVIPEPPMSIG